MTVFLQKRWLETRLNEAKSSLIKHGVPAHVLQCELKIVDPRYDGSSFSTVRAWVIGHTVFMANWWVPVVYRTRANKCTERLLRHELGHIITNRSRKLQAHFKFPPRYSKKVHFQKKMEYVLRGFRNYGAIHPLERFAEDIANLDRGTIQKVAKLCAA